VSHEGCKRAELPRQLSGDRSKVWPLRALVTDPTLVMSDDPTGNLDSQSARDVLGSLQSWRVKSSDRDHDHA